MKLGYKGIVVGAMAIVVLLVGTMDAVAQLPILTRELQLQPAGAGNTTSITKASNDGGLVITNIPLTATLADENVLVIGPSSNVVTRMAMSTITQGTAWGLSGNTGINGATNYLGTTDNQPLVIKTFGAERMRIASSGLVGIGENDPGNMLHVTGTTTGQGITIENTAGAATLRMSNNANEQYTITQTGGASSKLEFAGATTVIAVSEAGLDLSEPLRVNTNTGFDAGDAGDVLISAGSTNPPQWQSLSAAIGIRAVGRAQTGPTAGSPSPANTVEVTGVTDLGANDAIIVTIEGSNSVVVPAVTARTAGANGSFTITFSGTYTGYVNYMVIGQVTP